MKEAPFPLLVGCERSGTSLLAAMLDSHPMMAVTGECEFALSLAPHADRYVGEPFDFVAFARDVSAHPGFWRWGMDARSVNEAVASAAPHTFTEAVRAVYRGYARTRGKRRFADKTSRYVMEIPTLASLLPEARFVHVIRDGRDVALSLASIGRGACSVEEAGLLWRKRVAHGLGEGRALGDKRYLEVRYEALVQAPAHALRPVCDFLELGFHPDMLRHGEYWQRFSGTASFHGENRRAAEPVASGRRDWRRDLPQQSQNRFVSLAGDWLEKLGYEVEPVHLPVRTRLNLGVRRSGIGARAVVRRLAARGHRR